MGFPHFQDCPTCNKAPASTNYPKGMIAEIPCDNCNGLPCDSNQGRFHDRVLEDFMVPLAGNSVEVSVCDPSLWASCQWIAACYPNAKNHVAIFKIVSVNVANSKITIFNGCKDGSAISSNPSPGTRIEKNAIIYPVTPPTCSAELCEQVSKAIEDPECACTAVTNCLKASKEVCFTSVVDIKENEEVHLFGGTVPAGGGDNFYASCLRKLKKIFSGFNGKTLCFGEPQGYDSDATNSYLLIDANGCIRKGVDFKGSACNDETNVDDGILDQVFGCVDGQQATIKPSNESMVLSSCKNESNVNFWKEAKLGLSFFPVLNQTVYAAGGGPRTITHLTDADVPPKFCNRKRYAQFLVQATGCSATNQSIGTTITINGVIALITYYERECRTLGAQAMVPVDDADPKTFNVQISGIGSAALIFMGYWA